MPMPMPRPRESRESRSGATLSAGVVVVHETAGGWRVLLLRAYAYWDCPKGVVEAGEDPLATARREVHEETGITDLEFRWGEDFLETEPYARNKVARYYLAAAARDDVRLSVSAELGRPEHHEYRWATFAEARSLTVPRVSSVLGWAAHRVLA